MRTGDRPDPEQMRIFARLDAASKLALAQRLREEALSLKQAWLRQRHPHEDDTAIHRRLRAWQLHGRSLAGLSSSSSASRRSVSSTW